MHGKTDICDLWVFVKNVLTVIFSNLMFGVSMDMKSR